MARSSGPWQTRVSFAPDGSFAYRPGEVLVRKTEYLETLETLYELEGQRQRLDALPDEEEKRNEKLFGYFWQEGDENIKISDQSSFVRLRGVPDTLDAIRKLNQSGIYAQPNHVLFAHTQPGPAGDGLQANPFYANPFYANPFYANPFYANPNPAANPSFRETGRRPSSARPADADRLELVPQTDGGPSVAILDTGLEGTVHEALAERGKLSNGQDEPPDKPDLDDQGYLDPVAGHGTFIAGIIRQLAPSCKITVHKVLESFGDSDEVRVTEKLFELVGDGRPDFVNLSFGGYSTTGMATLAEAIAALHYDGATIVASAGNDATSVPMYPAALPHVLAVGALDHEGNPAPFTNFGPWVRACTLGVEIESTFFAFEGKHPEQAATDIDSFSGWAVWSGTSFAAPRVVAALAQFMDSGGDSHDAVKNVIDLDDLERIPMLGKVIEPLNTTAIGTV